MTERQHGGFKVTLMPNGKRLDQLPSYGYTENVGFSFLYSHPQSDSFAFVAGAGKSVLWYVYLPKFLML